MFEWFSNQTQPYCQAQLFESISPKKTLAQEKKKGVSTTSNFYWTEKESNTGF